MAVIEDLAWEAVSLLQALIRIDTTNPGRPEAPAAQLVADFLTRHGVETQTLGPEPGRTSAAARVPGTVPDAPALLLLSHLDTVPVTRPEDWRHGPVSGDIADGYVWGRGALDDKGRTAINAATMAALAQERPPGDVLFVAAADEEEAGEMGVRWLMREHPHLLAASYALGEGGGFRGTLGAKEFYTYALAEKGAMRVHLRFRGGSTGHASVPGRVAIAEVAAQATLRLATLPWPWTPTDATAEMLKELRQGQPFLRRLALRALASRPLGPVLLRQGIGLSVEQRDALHAMFHTTVAVTTLSAGQGAGVLPDEAEVQLAVRYLRARDRDETIRRIRASVTDLQIQPEVTIDKEARPRSSPVNSPLAATIRQVMARLDPGVSLTPTLLPASSDLRELEKGVVAYGFTPMRGLTADQVTRLVHGRDERMAVADVAFGIAATTEIARQLGSAP